MADSAAALSFSVIVTAHNNEHLIRKTLQSVEDAVRHFEREESGDAEVVIVEDGSTDNTYLTILDFTKNNDLYTVIHRSKSSSPSCARNIGAAQARGALLFFLDGDDLFLPGHIVECVRALRDPNVDFVKTQAQVSDPVHADWRPIIDNSIVINLCVRRHCHDAINGFPDYHIFRRTGDDFAHEMDLFFKTEDMFYNMLLSSRFRGAHLPTPTVQYCRHPGNAFDRQYEKFQKPYGQHPENNDADKQFRLHAGELFIRHKIALAGERRSPSFTNDWFSKNIPVWEMVLSPYKHRPNLRFLEIGCYEGQSALWLLQNILTDPSSRLCCIDTFKGSAEHSGMNLHGLHDRFRNNIGAHAERVEIMKDTSLRALSAMQHDTVRFDFIYVDGSHVAIDVLTDAALSFPLLKIGGILVFDDYQFPLGKTDWDKPQMAIDAFLKIYEQRCKVIHKGYQVIVSKMY